ncbi:NUDIX hydrolase [bacterium]|nr:NUDIX hydrolase [bacterium]
MQPVLHTLNPHVSVDCVVFGFDRSALHVLLIERKREQGDLRIKTALPGDLVWEDESLDEAASRVLKELTSLEGIFLKQFRAFGDPNRVRDVKDLDWLSSFREQPQARVITIGYYAFIRMSDFEPEASSFASRVFWQDIHSIPNLAFDHNQITEEAIEVLRADFENRKAGFELLPEKFTLSQLQSLYECILDRKLDKRNFRKKVLKENLITPLPEKQTGVLHKPAQLFELSQHG